MPSVSVRFSNGALTPKGELSNSAVAFKATVRKALIHLGLAGSVEEVELMVDVDRYCADENVEPVRVCVELMEVVSIANRRVALRNALAKSLAGDPYLALHERLPGENPEKCLQVVLRIGGHACGAVYYWDGRKVSGSEWDAPYLRKHYDD